MMASETIDTMLPKRILVVDDDETIRLLARASLEAAGYAVSESPDDRSVRDAFLKTVPDLVLLDVILPGKDGFAVCGEIRALPYGMDVPIIMMTGLDDVESISKAYEAGATDFIVKPINWQILVYRVQYILRANHAFRELRSNEIRLLRAKEAAEAASLAKSQFLANMSHEFLTPMNGVLGMIQLLQHSELTPEQYEYTETAKKSGNDLVRLLSDILDLSKVEAHKLELESSRFNLRDMLSGTIDILLLQARECGLELGYLIDPGVPLLLQGDVGRLRQVLVNLVGNAIKFTPNGYVQIHIQNNGEDSGSVTLRILVRDSGIGIAPDKLEQVFEPFTQADGSTTRKYGGSGLGLAICRQLVGLMGGTMGLESLEGKGSTFWFELKLKKQMTVDSLPTSLLDLVGRFGKSGPAGTGLPVLLAEDDPTNLVVIRHFLEKLGCTVDVAVNGEEVLNALYDNEYALILMDCMMPVMNGYEATVAIRDQASTVRNHDIPIIALTANAMRDDSGKCLAAGMDDYLEKPLQLPLLVAMLERWMSTKDSQCA